LQAIVTTPKSALRPIRAALAVNAAVGCFGMHDDAHVVILRNLELTELHEYSPYLQ
jgi:hypothetical protein